MGLEREGEESCGKWREGVVEGWVLGGEESEVRKLCGRLRGVE